MATDSIINRRRISQTQQDFSLGLARHLVSDLFHANGFIFWADFLVSTIVGNVAFAMVRKFELFDWRQIGLFFVAAFCFYRCVLFIHEIVHLRAGTFRTFRFVWNLICGIPMLVPSFMYYTHLDHHRRKHYGTAHDGEYIPLGQQSTTAILVYLLQPLVIPVLAIVRFMFLTPLTWFRSPLQKWVYSHASAMVMDPAYVRPYPTPEMLRIWRFQEFGCFVWCWTVAAMLWRGTFLSSVTPEMLNRPILNFVLPISFLLQAYLTALVILYVNSIRTLGAHRFLNDGREMTFAEQLLDSVNYTHWPIITSIWAPVGLRFHALHHLFPSLPYHNLAVAHARLMAELPHDSIYRRTNSDSLLRTLSELWSAAHEAAQERTHLPQNQTAEAA